MTHPPLEVRIDEIVADDPTLDRVTLQRAIEAALSTIEASPSVAPSHAGIVRLDAGAGANAIAGAVARTVAASVGSEAAVHGAQRESRR